MTKKAGRDPKPFVPRVTIQTHCLLFKNDFE